MTFARALAFVLRAEGGYVHDPVDPGGETNFGISRRDHPDVDIKNLTPDQAAAIYRAAYWVPAQCDHLPDLLAIVHFDTAVNQGVHQAALLLQRAAGVTEDAIVGPHTMSAIERASAGAGELALCQRYLLERVFVYDLTVQAKPALGKFLHGWLVRVKHLDRELHV